MDNETLTRTRTLAILWQIAQLAAAAMEHVSDRTDDTEGDLAGILNFTLETLHKDGKLTSVQAETLASALTDAAKEALYYSVYADARERFAQGQEAALKETQAAVPEYGTVAFQLN